MDKVAYSKNIRVGTGTARLEKIAIRIELREAEKGLELSMVGEIGHNCGGQCQDEMRRMLGAGEIEGAHHPQLERMLDIWDRWHLNGMRAGCEHQRKGWDVAAPVVLVTYRLKSEVWQAQDALKKAAEKTLKAGHGVKWTPDEVELMNLEWEVTVDADEAAPGPRYEEKKRETKRAGWTYPKESPKGLLCRPCPTCGYKYGSAWLHEELPPEIIEEVKSW